jgi:hypothetical protein
VVGLWLVEIFDVVGIGRGQLGVGHVNQVPRIDLRPHANTPLTSDAIFAVAAEA